VLRMIDILQSIRYIITTKNIDPGEPNRGLYGRCEDEGREIEASVGESRQRLSYYRTTKVTDEPGWKAQGGRDAHHPPTPNRFTFQSIKATAKHLQVFCDSVYLGDSPSFSCPISDESDV